MDQKTMKNGSNHAEVFCKRDVLSNFAKFTGNHLCQSLFFDKVGGLPFQSAISIKLQSKFIETKLLHGRPATLLKNRLRHRCFPVNFAKFLRTPFFIKHLSWLLLLHVRLGFEYTTEEIYK